MSGGEAGMGRAMTGRAMTEAQLLACVTNLARLLGWQVMHPWISVRTAPGYPDLTLVRDGRLIFAELKSDTGRLSAAQQEWLDALRRVPCAEVYVWRCADWHDGTVERVLR